MKKPIHIVLFIVAALFVLFLLSTPVGFRFESISPSQSVVVRGHAFMGSKRGPLNGALRLFINEAKYQTVIPFGRDLEIKWNEAGSGEVFTISKSDIVLMKWQVDGDVISCLEGKDYLVDDPYLEVVPEQAPSPRATPD